jgi:hypothetical protein
MNTFDEDELILDYAGAAYGYIIFIEATALQRIIIHQTDTTTGCEIKVIH